MKNFMILSEALNYIEANISEPITRSDIADHCYVSLSSMEKLFRYALTFSIRDYIERRHMTLAAGEIARSGISVTKAAMKYQYNSVEVFSRAFKRVWNTTPSEFTAHWRFTGIFPKINFKYNKGEELFMARKRVDVSEAYDFIRERSGCYVLCFDGMHFSHFNAVSRKAGDLALLELVARIESEASDDMLVLRIGGDEFALITDLRDPAEAELLAERIKQKNGETITFEGQELPLSLWCGIMKIPSTLRYDEFFAELHKTIVDSKK